MENSKQWSSNTPGYIIFLVDQSGSMAETYHDTETKADFTSTVINRTILELIDKNTSGEAVKSRVKISIIGYGRWADNPVHEIRTDLLSDFADKPKLSKKVEKKVPDGAGGLVTLDFTMPVFIEPLAEGITPMSKALEAAKELIIDHIDQNPSSPAPVIINISDGMPYEGEEEGKSDFQLMEEAKTKTIEVANEIMNIQTDDGNPLIFNVHIESNGREIGFCENIESIDNDQGKFLYKISSLMPPSFIETAENQGWPFKISEKSKVFISGASPEKLIGFLNFGSSQPKKMDLGSAIID